MSKLSKRKPAGGEDKHPFAGMSQMRPDAAGLDIGADEIVGCVSGEEENTQEVRTFGTYTSSLIKPRWEVTAEAAAAIMAAGAGKKDNRSKNAPEQVQSRAHIKRITGVDLVAVPGISASLAQTIMAEVGTDMSKFRNDKHFCSWLGLAPKNEVSGGKILRSRTLRTQNRAGQAFRLAAQSLTRSDSEFGAFYRRLKGRVGPTQALVATAHKLARVVYHMLSNREEYRPLGGRSV